MDVTSGLSVYLGGVLEHSGYCISLLAQTRHSLLQSVLLGASRLLSLSGRRWGFLFQKCVTNTSPSHGSCWQQLQQSICCHFLLPVLSHSAHSRPLTGLCSADQQGSINEQTLTITSQLWLSRKRLCVLTRTSFICLIIVWLELESITEEAIETCFILLFCSFETL